MAKWIALSGPTAKVKVMYSHAAASTTTWNPTPRYDSRVRIAGRDPVLTLSGKSVCCQRPEMHWFDTLSRRNYLRRVLLYYQSRAFRTLKGGTPAMRRAILERFPQLADLTIMPPPLSGG